MEVEALDYNQVRLTFTEPSGTHWGYDLDISWDGGSTWHWWRRVPTAANTLSWTGRDYDGVILMAGFAASTTYHFRLRTVEPGDDSETFGEWSSSVNCTTPSYRTASGGGVTVYSVSDMSSWQTARDNCKYGDFIDIQANLLLPGYQECYLPDPQAGGTNGFVTIRTPNVAHTPYVRADGADKTSYGGFKNAQSNDPAFMTYYGVDRICFESVRFENADSYQVNAPLLAIGYDGENWNFVFPDNANDQPSHIECHGCLFLNTPKTKLSEMLWTDGHFIVGQDSYFAVPTFQSGGTESHCIGGVGGTVKWFANNYFEAESVHCFQGGSAAGYPHAITCCVWYRNHHYRDPSWVYDTDYAVKNFWECKNLRWGHIEACLMEHNWVGSNQNMSFIFYPWMNADDATVTERIYITYNRMREMTGGISLCNGLIYEYNSPLAATSRIQIENNELSKLRDTQWGTKCGNGDAIEWAGGGQQKDPKIGSHVYVRHNTILSENTTKYRSCLGSSVGYDDWPLWDDPIVIEDNVIFGGQYGLWVGLNFGGSGGYGYSALDTFFGSGNWTWRNNAQYTTEASERWLNTTTYYPEEACPGCILDPDLRSIADLGFVDYDGGDYTPDVGSPLLNAASDGGNIGADIAEINTRTAHCIDGDWT